jgi:hypothetical protein
MIVSLHADHSIVTSKSQDDMTLESQRDGESALLFHWSSPTFNKVQFAAAIPPAFCLCVIFTAMLQLIPGGYSGPNGRSGGLTKDEIYEPSDDLIRTVCIIPSPV